MHACMGAFIHTHTHTHTEPVIIIIFKTSFHEAIHYLKLPKGWHALLESFNVWHAQLMMSDDLHAYYTMSQDNKNVHYQISQRNS